MRDALTASATAAATVLGWAIGWIFGGVVSRAKITKDLSFSVNVPFMLSRTIRVT